MFVFFHNFFLVVLIIIQGIFKKFPGILQLTLVPRFNCGSDIIDVLKLMTAGCTSPLNCKCKLEANYGAISRRILTS